LALTICIQTTALFWIPLHLDGPRRLFGFHLLPDGAKEMRLPSTCYPHPLTRGRYDSNVDRVKLETDKRSGTSARDSVPRFEPFVLLLVFATFALGFHIRLAHYENLATFPGKHILHGDLRPSVDKPEKRFAKLHGATPFVLAANAPRHVTAFPSLISSSVLPVSEPSVREFTSYLALIVHPPPPLPEAPD
jgi:hypothetical protein